MKNDAADFSKESTQKALLRDTLQHPMTLGFAALGILGGATQLILGTGMVGLLTGIGGLSLASISWLVNFHFRRNRFTDRYIKQLKARLQEQSSKAIQTIQTELQSMQGEPDLKDFCQQGAQQFAMSQEKFDTLKHILSNKLDQSEMTYSRYLGTAEQVHMAILDNLLKAVFAMQSIRSADIDYIQQRLNALSQLPKLDEADRKEEFTLRERFTMRQKQANLVNELLTVNEEAMTSLDKTTMAIAQLDTTEKRAKVKLEDAMKELRELADRVDSYNQNQ